MKIVIFGGSGSFGTAMTKKLLDSDYEVIIFSRNEKLQFDLFSAGMKLQFLICPLKSFLQKSHFTPKRL